MKKKKTPDEQKQTHIQTNKRITLNVNIRQINIRKDNSELKKDRKANKAMTLNVKIRCWSNNRVTLQLPRPNNRL
jgi:hypothetical protein